MANKSGAYKNTLYKIYMILPKHIFIEYIYHFPNFLMFVPNVIQVKYVIINMKTLNCSNKREY